MCQSLIKTICHHHTVAQHDCHTVERKRLCWCWFKLFGSDTPHVIQLIKNFLLLFFFSNLLYLCCLSFPASFTYRVVHQFSFYGTLECLPWLITQSFSCSLNLAIKCNSGPSLCSLQLRCNQASKPQTLHPEKALVSVQSTEMLCCLWLLFNRILTSW